MKRLADMEALGFTTSNGIAVNLISPRGTPVSTYEPSSCEYALRFVTATRAPAIGCHRRRLDRGSWSRPRVESRSLRCLTRLDLNGHTIHRIGQALRAREHEVTPRREPIDPEVSARVGERRPPSGALNAARARGTYTYACATGSRVSSRITRPTIVASGTSAKSVFTRPGTIAVYTIVPNPRPTLRRSQSGPARLDAQLVRAFVVGRHGRTAGHVAVAALRSSRAMRAFAIAPPDASRTVPIHRRVTRAERELELVRAAPMGFADRHRAWRSRVAGPTRAR